jgi:hypothetical protein
LLSITCWLLRQWWAFGNNSWRCTKSSLVSAYWSEPSFCWILPILIIGRRVGASEVTSIHVNIHS